MVRRGPSARPPQRVPSRSAPLYDSRPALLDGLDDQSLTDTGLSAPPKRTGPKRTGQILLIACGALAREILDIKTRGGWDHMDLTCLPAILHNHPDRITDAVTAMVEKHRTSYDNIYVIYADCGTGGLLQAACKTLGVEMMAGPHCYSFYEGNQAFADRGDSEITAFYLTDFLVRQFDTFIWKPLGLDRHPELRDSYFGHYEKLVYQAQTTDPTLTAKAKSCAARLGLAFEHRQTDYGDLATTLKQWSEKPK